MPGIEVASTDTYADALGELRRKPADHFGAILVDGAAPIGCTQDEVEREIDRFITSLRGEKKGESGKERAESRTPVLLWSSYPAK
jgi:hypothetical protein